MGIFGKIFGKKEEMEAPPEGLSPGELALGKDEAGLGKEHEVGMKEPEMEEPLGAGLTPPGMPSGEPMGAPQGMGGAPQAPTQGHAGVSAPVFVPSPGARDIEVVSAKLDAVKATLDSINQRLENIEKMAREGL